ncbi:MAG: hypothetical protein JO102_06020, partial [Elusimicrobia bacterium]|nr:hypothetical protein [Elusimicrobiota bacterium]
ERVDRYINFRWGMGGPFFLWRRDNFSIRWTGFLRVPQAGRYEFVVFADDGFRLFIDSRPIMQDWSIHKVREKRATVSLAEGYHPITIAYYEKAGQAAMDVYWKRPGDNRPVQLGGDALVPGEEYIHDELPVFKGASEQMPDGTSDNADTTAGPDNDAEAP